MNSTFEKMCRNLNQDKECIMQVACKSGKQYNEIICAQKAVKEYVNSDKNKLLKLKAEAESENFLDYLNGCLSFLAILVSSLSLLCQMFNVCKVVISIVACLMVAIILIAFFIRKYSCVHRWRPYILVVINDLEKNL
jgi:hypothetical protein